MCDSQKIAFACVQAGCVRSQQADQLYLRISCAPTATHLGLHRLFGHSHAHLTCHVYVLMRRSLRTFRDKIPAALAEAFDHPEADSEALSEPPVALPNLSDYAHGHGVQTRRWSGASSNSTPASLPWWAGGTSGSSSDVSSSMSSSNVMGSPSTPMMVSMAHAFLRARST